MVTTTIYVLKNVNISLPIHRYISRFDERLAEINEQNKLNKGLGRHGQYHAAEEKGIKMVKEKEQELFTAGKFGKGKKFLCFLLMNVFADNKRYDSIFAF